MPQVILTNMPNGDDEKPTTLNVGRMSGKAGQNFVKNILQLDPKDNEGDNHTCGFNLYYHQNAVRVVPYDKPKTWQPFNQKNEENELVIEIIPITTKDCGSWANYQCPMCLASGECTSPFIKKYIGEVLFPKKYGKQR